MKEELEFLHNNLNNADFQFAKSMPKIPHWYTLRKNWDSNSFNKVVEFIRKYGYIEKFKGKKYVYFNSNGFKYWTMGAPINETILINKSKINYQSKYDDISKEYNDFFSQPDFKNEDKELFKKLKIEGSVLDVGCGSGLLLENINPDDYLGIDISKNMLDILKTKSPQFETINTSFEDFHSSNKYDTIVSLYGTPSYIDPNILLSKVKYMLNDNGKFYLMYFKDDYHPITHKKFNIEIDTYPVPDCGLNRIEFNNYIIITNENI